MPRLTLEHDANASIVEVQPNSTLSEALKCAGFPLEQPCAGRGSCGKCRVEASGMLDLPGKTERDTLPAALLEAGFRLACLARIEGDVTVRLPKKRAFTRIATGGAPAVSPGATARYSAYGAAVDIGTSTLCVQLYCKEGLLQTAACKNPQVAFGADVISRIAASMAGEAQALQRAVAGAVEGLLRTCICKQGITAQQVDALVLTGNTAMLYLIAAKDPTSLSHAPFHAAHLFGETVPGEALGLKAFAHAHCYLPGCIGAYLGADIANAILASNMQSAHTCALLADIGTNGEIALHHGGRLYACSTAAGPAFEGAGIEQGSLGVPGAIDTVALEGGRLVIGTVENAPPRSICGSGVIDALGCFLEAGALDETGRIEEASPFARKNAASALFLPLTPDISLTQRDIRAVQLAKASICAGIVTLLDACGCAPEEVEAFYIAGGFGAYLNLMRAAQIGLFPKALLKKARTLGNAALEGAALLLQDTSKEAGLDAIVSSATAIDLGANPSFMERYIGAMGFE